MLQQFISQARSWSVVLCCSNVNVVGSHHGYIERPSLPVKTVRDRQPWKNARAQWKFASWCVQRCKGFRRENQQHDNLLFSWCRRGQSNMCRPGDQTRTDSGQIVAVRVTLNNLKNNPLGAQHAMPNVSVLGKPRPTLGPLLQSSETHGGPAPGPYLPGGPLKVNRGINEIRLTAVTEHWALQSMRPTPCRGLQKCCISGPSLELGVGDPSVWVTWHGPQQGFAWPFQTKQPGSQEKDPRAEKSIQ
jgi:hypothetical protein